MIGNVVFYSVDGKQYARARPRKQSKSTRKRKQTPANDLFGMVSACGSSLISCLAERLLFSPKLYGWNALRGWMRNCYARNHGAQYWPLSVAESGHCQINKAVDLRDRFRVPVEVTDRGNGKVEIEIGSVNPAKDISAPSATGAVNIKLMLFATAFGTTRSMVKEAVTEYQLPFENKMHPAKKFVLDSGASAEEVAIVVIALEYKMKDAVLMNEYNRIPRHLPAAAIAMGRLQ